MNASESSSQAGEKVCAALITMKLNNPETPHPVTGILKGYDQLLNLVLDDVTEELQCALIQGFNEKPPKLADPFPTVPEPHTRSLGLTVLRGPTITVLNPVDGSEEIANPFLPAEQ
jgi:U6 snRNA-associated Sm-like protein LSm7